MAKSRRPGYRICFTGSDTQEQVELVAERDFRVREAALCEGLISGLSVRERDLLRIAGGIYVADRLVRRSVHRSRCIRFEVEVGDVDFWGAGQVKRLIEDVLWHLSDDVWDLTFMPGKPATKQRYLPFPHEVKRVCLYSGGLDSASGLASLLRAAQYPTLALTVFHHAGLRKRVRKHMDVLSEHYGCQVFPLFPRVAMVGPPRMSQQETTQRCRAFLFLAFGGVVAARVASPQVEVFENGVGALNLPLMAGMLIGSRTTKGAHPHFLRLMSDLISCLSEKKVDFILPFRHSTKAEMVRTLREDGLEEIARETVSCSRYPVRTKGGAQQCGWCPGCIGRRQSMIEAGIAENPQAYQYDLFPPPGLANEVPEVKLAFIKAHLMQLAQLAKLKDDGSSPDILRQHVASTNFLEQGEPIRAWIDLLRRYRREWLKLVGMGHRSGWPWAVWFPGSGLAA